MTNRKKILLALAVGIVGAAAAHTVPQDVQCQVRAQAKEARPITAWWGTLYPKFCFAELPENTGENINEKTNGNADKKIDKKTADVKISFWLARVLDW